MAGGYLLAASADENTISLLHNESARTDELGYSLLAMVVAGGSIVVTLAMRRWIGGWLLGLLGLGFAAAAGAAVDASDQPDRLVSTLVLVAPATSLLAIGGVLWCAAADRRRVAVGGFVAGFALLGLGLASTWLEDPIEQAQLFAGLQPGWEVEDAVDNVFVDDAGRVWGVRPWEATEPASLYLRGEGSADFELVRTRDAGWPPQVVGSDADGQTWFVSSEAQDPFEPLVETYRSGRVERTARPRVALPAFDAVALDRQEGVLYGLHSDFALPTEAVLEVFDGSRWRTVSTPITHAGRLAFVDAAVGRDGGLWVWHDGEAKVLYRYERESWSTRRLPFDVEPTVETAPAETTLDPFRTFIPGADGELWLFDRDASRLVRLPPDGRIGRGRPLPSGAVPLAVDRSGVAWCRGPTGLLLVDDRGAVRYDSTAEGMPNIRIEAIAVAEATAWVRAMVGDSRHLLRFEHGDVLGQRVPPGASRSSRASSGATG